MLVFQALITELINKNSFIDVGDVAILKPIFSYVRIDPAQREATSLVACIWSKNDYGWKCRNIMSVYYILLN